MQTSPPVLAAASIVLQSKSARKATGELSFKLGRSPFRHAMSGLMNAACQGRKPGCSMDTDLSRLCGKNTAKPALGGGEFAIERKATQHQAKARFFYLHPSNRQIRIGGRASLSHEKNRYHGLSFSLCTWLYPQDPTTLHYLLHHPEIWLCQCLLRYGVHSAR